MEPHCSKDNINSHLLGISLSSILPPSGTLAKVSKTFYLDLVQKTSETYAMNFRGVVAVAK